MDSFVGNHSGLFSDWMATSSTAGKPPPPRRRSPTRRRRKKPEPAKDEARKGSHVNDRHVNRHSREAIKIEVQARRAHANRGQFRLDTVILEGTVMKRNELAALQKESGFGTQELQAVMKSFKSHSSYDEKNPVVNKEHFAEVMGDVFEHMNRALADKLFDSMDDGEPLSPRQPLPYRLTSHSTRALIRE